MKFVLVLLLLTANAAWANMSSQCELTEGFFKNSNVPLTNVKFETLTDVFSLNNAKSFLLELNGESIRFTRLNMMTDKQTHMEYVNRKNGKIVRTAKILIDRTGFEALDSRDFNGIIQISQDNTKLLTYNFYCSF